MMNWQDQFKVNLLEVLYRPDQPRVSAGVPERGQKHQEMLEDIADYQTQGDEE